MEGEEICTLRIELADSDPPIWREVDVPTSITLETLHDVIQAAMGWDDGHLWEFTLGKQRFGTPSRDDWGSAPVAAAAKVRLHEVLKPRRTAMTYLYDFGDSWEHILTFTRTRKGEPGIGYPRYVAGEGNAPPEDCGGIPGFYEMLDAVADPSHPDHAEIREWLGDYDPAKPDAVRLGLAVGRIAKRRKAVRKRGHTPS